MNARRLGKTAAVAAALCGAAAGILWADEIIEMATYIPAPGTGNDLDRLHARRATIGDPYSLNPANPAEPDPPNGTLLVAQKVGIGTAAPEAMLDADGLGRFRSSGPVPASGAGLELYYVSATEGLIGGWVSAIDRGAPAYKDLFLSGSSLRFHTSGFERMRVDSGGNVGIGVTSPTQQLELPVDTVIKVGNAYFFEGDGGYAHMGLNAYYRGATGWQYPNPAAESYVLQFNPATHGIQFWARAADAPGVAMRFRIGLDGVVSGAFGAYHSPSDGRLKRDIAGIPHALDKVLALRGVSFRWKDPEEDARDGVRLGLVAQEVEPVIPELVHTSSHGGIKAVDFAQLTAVLVEAVKELKAENAVLRKRVEALERNPGADPGR